MDKPSVFTCMLICWLVNIQYTASYWLKLREKDGENLLFGYNKLIFRLLMVQIVFIFNCNFHQMIYWPNLIMHNYFRESLLGVTTK